MDTMTSTYGMEAMVSCRAEQTMPYTGLQVPLQLPDPPTLPPSDPASGWASE